MILKLAKEAHSREIAISIRPKDSAFNSYFIQAFIIAISLHAVALCLFQATPFNLGSSFIFAPVHVEADDRFITQVISSLNDTDSYVKQLFPELKFIPLFPLENISTDYQIQAVHIENADMKVLEVLERQIWPAWHDQITILDKMPHVHMDISTELADYPLLISHPLLYDSSLDAPQVGNIPIEMLYRVTIADTGKIFWYEQIESEAPVNLNKLAETILFNLKFANISHIVNGSIKLTFLPAKSNISQSVD